MAIFGQQLLSGISLGAVYALLALGFVIIFKATRVVNFAHPALLVIGAYLTARLSSTYHWNFWLAVLTAVATAIVAALVIQRFLVHPMAAKSVTAISIMTLGVDLIIRTEVNREMPPDGLIAAPDPWGAKLYRLFGLSIPVTRVVALAAGIAIIVGFFLWFKFSSVGIAMRAVAEDAETASLMGISRARIAALAWAIAGLLAAIAGLFLTVYPTSGYNYQTFTAALVAFPAAILGGLDSIEGAIVGGLVVGVSVTLAQGYTDRLMIGSHHLSDYIGKNFFEVLPYLLMVLVLLVRPTGLFGTRELHRV